MSDSSSGVDAFLARFTAWARARSDVRGALLVGSRARRTQPADALSDVDLLMITSRPRFYAATATWLRELGEVVLSCTFSTVVGTRAVRSVELDVGGAPLHVDFAMVGRDDDDAWRALFASTRLFSWLARETAEALGHRHPSHAETRVDAWLRERFASRATRDAGEHGR